MTEPQPLPQSASLPAHPPGALLHTESDLMGVLVTQEWRRLIAIAPIVAGQRLFVINGRETAVPTRYSIQVGPSLHLDQECAHDIHEMVRRYYWRYMDHACDPTTLIRNRSVIARRDIEVGEGITFNYNTTEYELAEPFRCRCDSALCIGVVRGARFLTPPQRELVRGWLADYLR